MTIESRKDCVGIAGFPALLTDAALISHSDLALAERHAVHEQMSLADAVVALGLVREEDSYAKLAEAGGFEVVDLERAVSSELAVRLMPEQIARRYFVVPLKVDNRTLTYATSQPYNTEAERDVGFACGRRTRIVAATRSAVLNALDRCYPKLRELDVLATRLRSEHAVVESPDQGDGTKSDAVVMDLCNHLIGRAVEVGASHVQVACDSSGTHVRYRICGVLEPVLTLPASVSQPIRDRFKIMARVSIAVRHMPQDGTFRLIVSGRPIDVRLSTLLAVDGEKLVMRVLDSHSPLLSLDRLGYELDMLERLEGALSRPDGLVLVTGPPGSGKTTALYAALGHLRGGRADIVSVEDPVERTVPGVTQIPVSGRASNTFAAVLRSLVGQGPTVIMVGEIRDAEVAQIAGQAAYTGHLVLTSMHTPDAATAITRLTTLGFQPFKIVECLSAVLAQRLLRSLCPYCKKANNESEARRLGTAHHLAAVPASAGPGCEHCRHTGYRGRVPIAELLTPSDELREAIVGGAAAHDIRAAMHASGTSTMRDHAMRLVSEGLTSIEEVNRILAEDVDGEQSTGRIRSRVLIADDEPITRMLVRLLLERENFEVLEASNGKQAVDIATRERPDLMIVDLNMPEMDGYEAIATLRRDITMATLPIMVLTSQEGPDVERRVLELGADDYIIKPFDPTVLLSRVNAVFRRLKVMAA